MKLNTIKKIIYTDFVELNLPFIPRYLSKYDSYFEDFKSLSFYYILNKRKKYIPKIEGLIVVPTTICNANCVFCANRYLKDKRQIMSFEMFKKIINEYKEIEGKHISITPTLGDVFTDPNIFQKVEYLERKNISYSFYTNGILLGKYTGNILKSNLKILYIDIGDIIPKYDAKIFKISKTLSKNRLKNILILLEKLEKEKSKLIIQFSFRGSRQPKEIFTNFKKSPFFKYYIKGKLKLSFLQCYDNWGGLITKKELLGIQTLKRSPKIRKYPCQSFFNLSILPNGDIRLCGCRCLDTLKDELVIGNINRDSLKDLVKNKKWKNLINISRQKDIPTICQNCSFYRPKI